LNADIVSPETVVRLERSRERIAGCDFGAVLSNRSDQSCHGRDVLQAEEAKGTVDPVGGRAGLGRTQADTDRSLTRRVRERLLSVPEYGPEAVAAEVTELMPPARLAPITSPTFSVGKEYGATCRPPLHSQNPTTTMNWPPIRCRWPTSEALGCRATGIGVFFDDVNRNLSLALELGQVVYHLGNGLRGC
jgi:hypothetical protein